MSERTDVASWTREASLRDIMYVELFELLRYKHWTSDISCYIASTEWFICMCTIKWEL